MSARTTAARWARVRCAATALICPRHGAAFDPRTGKVLTLPAVRDVNAYRVTVDGDDVYVDCAGDS